MAANAWEWSNEQSAAIFYDENGIAKVTVTGITEAGKSGLSTNGRTITVSEAAFTGLAGGSSIQLVGSGYTFERGTGLRAAPEIDSESVTVTAVINGLASITGNVKDYYGLTDNSVTLNKGVTNANLAIISGLNTSNDAGLTIGTDKKTIQVDKTDLTSNGNVTLTAQSVSGIDSLDVSNYGFNFQLVNEGGGTSTSLGFGTGSNRWTLGAESKAAIYQSTTQEGWTRTNATTITYSSESYTGLATIGGFQQALSIHTVDGSGTTQVQLNSNRVIEETSYNGGMSFAVAKSGLSSVGTLTLTKNADVSDTYRLLFGSDTDGSVTNKDDGTTIFGLSAHKDQAYWRLDGTSIAIYQYNTDEGWTIDKAGVSISYTAATSGNTATALAQITGLSVGTALAGDSTINGISVANGTDTLRTITITNANIFNTITDGNKLNFIDSDLQDGIDFSFGLSSAIATMPAVNYGVSATSEAVAAGSSIAYVKGSLSAYYSLTGSASTVAGATVTYHAPSSAQTIATITGLSVGGQIEIGGVSLDKLILGSSDLKNSDVSLTLATGSISGIKNYSFSFASSGTSAVSAMSGVVDTAVHASLKTENNTYNVYGKTKEYYTLSGTSYVVYHKPEKEKLATIVGLSNVVTSSGEGQNASIGGASGRTIFLKESALGDGTVYIDNQRVGTSTEHGLKFQLMTADGTSAVSLGGNDSGNYWTLNNGSASFVHHTEKSWLLTGGEALLKYTAASTPEARLTITGLATDGIYKAVMQGTGISASIGTKDNQGTFTAGISFSGTSGTNVTIYQDLIGRDPNKTIKVNGAGYSFFLEGDTGSSNASLRDSVDNDGIVGLYNGKAAGEAYWSITSNGDAIYQYNTSEGWSYSSATGEIKYIPETVTTLATIKGLANPQYVATYKPGTSTAQITGISVAGTSILLDKDLLSRTSSITIIDAAGDEDVYTLGFSTAISSGSTAGFSNAGYVWDISGGNATYYSKTDEGWTLGDSGTKITYTSERHLRFARGCHGSQE